MNVKALPSLLKATFDSWNAHKAPQLASSLAYYAVFSLAPLVIIVIAIAGLVFGHQAAQDQIMGQLKGLLGDSGASIIQDMVKNASAQPASGILGTILGVIALLFGAAGAFGQIQAALNQLWDIPPQKGESGIKGILQTIKDRFLSLSMVLGTGFLLLVSLVISAALAGFANYAGQLFPFLSGILPIIEFLVSFIIITLLFAAIFKYLPDIPIAWHDVWLGAAMTSFLFAIGKFLIGLYLGHSSVASTYGAAGSLVIILLWIYYSAQILFFGAAFTKVYADKYGSHPVYQPSPAQKPSQSASKPDGRGKAVPDSNPRTKPAVQPSYAISAKLDKDPVVVKVNRVIRILEPVLLLITKIITERENIQEEKRKKASESR